MFGFFCAAAGTLAIILAATNAGRARHRFRRTVMSKTSLPKVGSI
jgi:hypothetical protein